MCLTYTRIRASLQKKKGKKKLAFFSTLTYHNTLMTPDSPANWVSSN